MMHTPICFSQLLTIMSCRVLAHSANCSSSRMPVGCTTLVKCFGFFKIFSFLLDQKTIAELSLPCLDWMTSRATWVLGRGMRKNLRQRLKRVMVDYFFKVMDQKCALRGKKVNRHVAGCRVLCRRVVGCRVLLWCLVGCRVLYRRLGYYSSLAYSITKQKTGPGCHCRKIETPACK